MPKHIFKQMEQSVVDLTAYPILTEEIGYPPSPMSQPSPRVQSPSGGAPVQGLGQVVAQAVGDVLGWKANASDPKGFIGALTQSFSLTEIEGRVESTWKPRTYTVQTDLAGGITGAQASLYTRAKDAQDQCLPLLDGLYPLDPEADPEYVKALREMAKSQIVEIVKQFAVVPPSILRVDTYFNILLGASRKEHFSDEPIVPTNPDEISGTLGSLRDIYGIWFEKSIAALGASRNNPFSNSVEDEQNITNFRVISDYMTSLLQSWRANGKYFRLTRKQAPAFLGTQLILMSRQFNVIAETVNEVRFTLDSVFIGPNERQQLLLEFKHPHLPAMYLEDVLREIDAFVTDEGPRLIRDGGRIAVSNNVIPVLDTFIEMVTETRHPGSMGKLPDGFRTPRVRNSFDDLRDQLGQLRDLAQQVGIPIPSASIV
jgi:hypothetical protein